MSLDVVLSLVLGSLVALLVRVISNKRVARARAELEETRDRVVELERDNFGLRTLCARNGIDPRKALEAGQSGKWAALSGDKDDDRED